MHKKIISIFLIILLISLIFISNNVFANDTTFTFTDRFGNEHTVPAFPQIEESGYKSSYHYAVVTKGNYKDALYIASGDGYFYGTSNLYCSTLCYIADVSNGQYVLRSATCSADARLCGVGEMCYFSGGCFDAKGSSTYTVEPMGDFFFHTVLRPILTKVEMKGKTMTEILTLVPIMIALLVSYLALRKGLAFIMTLRKM